MVSISHNKNTTTINTMAARNCSLSAGSDEHDDRVRKDGDVTACECGPESPGWRCGRHFILHNGAVLCSVVFVTCTALATTSPSQIIAVPVRKGGRLPYNPPVVRQVPMHWQCFEQSDVSRASS